MSDVQGRGRTILKWLLGFCGALVIGALGNGLWEYALKAGLAWIGNTLLEVSAFLWVGYLDRIYAEIGANYSDQLSVLPFVFAVVSLAAVPLFAAFVFHLRFKKLHRRLLALQTRFEDADWDASPPDIDYLVKDIEGRIKAVRPLIYRVFLPMAVFMAGLSCTFAAEIMYVRHAANWIERSIEILAPLLTPLQRAQLKSSFRSVETSRQFLDLEANLQSIASEKKPSFPSSHQ